MRAPADMRDRRTAPKPRRRVIPLWRRRALRFALPVLAIVAVVGGGTWSWYTGEMARWSRELSGWAVASTSRFGLTVEEVLVVGRDQTQRGDLMRAADLRRGMPILAFDPEDVRKRVEALPWVREAVIERRLPDTVFIRLVERRPMALWQNDDRFSLIDTEGAVIPVIGASSAFGDLLLVVGTDAPPHVPELLRILESEPDIMKRVVAAVWVGERRWNLRLDNGVDVRLPEEEAQAAWAKLAVLERSQHILARDVRVLDLRLPDRLIVRSTPSGAATTTGKGRET